MTSDAAVVRQALDRVRRRWRRLSSLQVATRLCAGVAAVWAAAWLVERAAIRGGAGVALIAAGALCLSGLWAGVVLWRRRRPPADRELARFIEEQYPELEDRLATAVDVSARQTPSVLVSSMLADAARALDRLEVDTVVPRDTLRRAALFAAVALVALAAAATLWVEPGGRAWRVAAMYLIPGRLVLEVSPGDARVKRGEPLAIGARTTAAQGGIVPELTVTVGDQARTVGMRRAEGDRFSWRFDQVPASFTYRVSAAGRSSDTYTVTVLDAPRVERIDLRFEYPAYTRLPARTEEDGGDIYAPNGTRVTVFVHTSKPVEEGALTLADGGRVPLAAAGAGTRQLEANLAITADGAYRVALADGDGLTSEGDTEYFIRVLNDRPPDVRILRPAGDRQVTPLEEVTIEARADDDYGVAAFDLVYGVRGGAEQIVPLGGDSSGLSVTGRHVLQLEALDVRPGDFVTYYARVRDVGRGRRSTEARSDIFFLEVKPFEEEFAAAQTQAMSGAGGNRALDDLVTAQKDIIVATWKLDRRATAGRSAQDVRAVARAQGDLKQRTERAASQTREPRRRPRPLQPGTSAPAADDPLSNAVEAMERARVSLEAVKTAAAIPAEMEALNHLLRAQAEVRRREVMRQQASGSGGGFNRAEQDLSTLFDRELQRQQQTNYETPRTSEERQDSTRDEALDKVRELARRQEQLARQQEDLAKNRARLSADDLRRRLERLTREQSELRRQAEQLARQLAEQPAPQRDGQREQGQPEGQAQSGSGQQRQGQAQGQSAAGAQLREVSEEMRAAASDLRREDPEKASARSGRALDRLRSLERQMQTGQPDERRRAMGDLQLEARQLADRQRELGEQAATSRGQPNVRDTRRRLAGEQDRLADRLKRLEEQVKEVGAAPVETGGDREALAQALREIDQQRLEERMRESASALRSGEDAAADRSSTRAAETAREVARSIDRVADRLGDATGTRDPEDRRLAEQLARARELRDRLGELRQQMQQLEQQEQTDQADPAGEARNGERSADARPPQSGGQPQSGPGGQSAGGDPAGSGEPQPGGRERELQRLRQDYAQELRDAARLQQELAGARQNTGGRGAATPEGQQMALSAPGTEAFKQDYSRWESLHKDVTLGLERVEASLSQALLERASRDRLKAGAADRAPEEYQRAVDEYFRSLAGSKP